MRPRWFVNFATDPFLLTPTRDRAAAEAFLHKAIRTQGLPEKITLDQSGSNTAAITRYNKIHKTVILLYEQGQGNKSRAAETAGLSLNEVILLPQLRSELTR